MDSTFIDFTGAGGDNEDNDEAIALEESEDEAQDKAVLLSKSDLLLDHSECVVGLVGGHPAVSKQCI